MSEHSYSFRIKDMLRKKGWTVISLETLGRGIPDCLCAKRKRFFLLEFKFEKNKINELQKIFYFDNQINIDIFILRKDDEGLKLFTDTNSYLFKSVKELIDYFERRIR
jgi:hypothetical protein